MKRPETVWVRNNGEETFDDRYDGENFEIRPGEAVEMLVECAQLCLGFGQEDKTRALRRKGWAFTHTGMQEGIAKLSKFSFHMTEREALAHDPNKAAEAKPIKNESAGSSAPSGDETSATSKDVSGEVIQQPARAKVGPLEKLAQARAG